MKKRVLCWVLVLSMMLSAMVMTASAADTGENSGTCGDNLSWVLDESGTLTISGNGPMDDYEHVGYAPWGMKWDTVLKVVIEDGVTSIGRCAFANLSKLADVSISDSVTSIGVAAFLWCNGLTAVDIPDSVTSMGKSAFDQCENLAEIRLSSSITVIEDFSFFICESLKSVVVPEGVTRIGETAFSFCTDLVNVELPKSLTTIDGWAFNGCGSLRSIVIPEGVTELGKCCFEKCDSLTSVTIPASVTMIADGAFLLCKNLKTVYYTGTQEQWEQIQIMQDNECLQEAELVFGSAPERVNPFIDVTRGDQFEPAILWAYYNNITKGTSATEFSPEKACTRKQIVTFLWRAAGCPEPESMENPFTDVTRGDQFEKAILWAYYAGITKGTSAIEFSPEATCTRKQIVTFLWRYHGNPEPESMDNPFGDVTRGDQFEKAILWAYYSGVTKGTSSTAFSPENPCTRKQIVTFLYRDLAE